MRLTRREFLCSIAAGAAAALLEKCAPAKTEPAPEPVIVDSGGAVVMFLNPDAPDRHFREFVRDVESRTWKAMHLPAEYP